MPDIDLNDPRWGDYIPWFFRHADAAVYGDFETFFERAAHRLLQVILHSEAGELNHSHFGFRLGSKSHQRFRYERALPVDAQIWNYFSRQKINADIDQLTNFDTETQLALRRKEDHQRDMVQKYGVDVVASRCESREATVAYQAVWDARRGLYRAMVVRERIGVLEVCLLLFLDLPKGKECLKELRLDLRHYLAETTLMLDISESGVILPLEEKLLQREVIDNLLPRLRARYPNRADDLVKAYHDILVGEDSNTVFGNAFKALEELARSLSGDKKLELKAQAEVQKAFPGIHGTIQNTIVKLAAQRGDEGAHGRLGPDIHEIRYLLFAICNVALLLLDYADKTKQN